MFDWTAFFGTLITTIILLLIVGAVAAGFYMMCEMGNAWGFALIVGGAVVGCSIAAGFGL